MDSGTRTSIRELEWRDALVRDAREWIGTPYHHKAKLKGIGCDCGGFLYSVYEPYFGPFPPFPTDYPPDWASHRDMERYLQFIMPLTTEVSSPDRGDFVLVKMGRAFSHAAIYMGNDTYIHSYGNRNLGGVIETSFHQLLRGNLGRAVKFFAPAKACNM